MRRMMSMDVMCTRSRVYSNYWWHAAFVVDALVMVDRVSVNGLGAQKMGP